VQTKDSIAALFKNTVKENIGLYNGGEYLYSGHNVKGFPYFKSADILQGSVYYDDNLYNNVSMYYDLVSKQLVILDYTKNFPVALISSKVKYFIIDNNRFFNASISNDLPLPLDDGFYQVLYNNKTSVYAKKEKQLVLAPKDENENHYKEFDYYFIYADNKLYKADNKKTVLNAFGKRKNELKKYIHANKVSFKKNFEDALIKVSTYYDQIEK
jgi:hypothetical protein